MKTLYNLFIFFSLGIFTSNAQEILTLEKAITLGIENNFDIKIAKNNLQIQKNNLTPGNAGMLPKISANFDLNNRIQNSKQIRQDGTENALNNAKNNAINYGVALDWTLFDGFKMFAKKEQLAKLEKNAQLELQNQLINKIAQINAQYFDFAQQNAQLKVLDSTVIISQMRFQLAQNRYNIGKASKLEVLNAQVDLNADQVALLKQKENLLKSKVNLLQILAIDLTTNFIPDNQFSLDKSLSIEDILQKANQQNAILQQQSLAIEIQNLQLKQLKANRYPVIKLNTGYNFLATESSLGFTKETSANGLFYGINASIPIFDGNNQNRTEKNQILAIENQKQQLQKFKQELNAQIFNTFQSYQTNLQWVDLEKNNLAIAKQNMQITLDKFKIGTIPTIEFRNAQLNLLQATLRFQNAQYQTKISEITLKQLAGTLTIN